MLKDVVIANKVYAKLNIADASTLDDIAIKVIKQDIPDFLVPFKMISIDGETEFRYEIGEGTRMNYLPDRMTKKEFVMLLEQMIQPINNCSDWFLDYHNFCLDVNYIFVGKNYTSVKYIYIPDSHYTQDEESVLNFFREYILNVNLSDDPVFVMNLYRRVKGKNTSLISILDYLHQDNVSLAVPTVNASERLAIVQEQNLMSEVLSDKLSVSEHSENKVSADNIPASSGFASNSKKNENFGKEDVKGALISNLFGEDESTALGGKAEKKVKEREKGRSLLKEATPKEKNKGFLGGIFGGGRTTDKEPVQRSEPVPQQPIRVQQMQTNAFYEEEDVTFIETDEALAHDETKLILQLEEDRGYHFPKFIEIDLSRGYATIGRFDKSGNAQSDYNFESALSFISRRHLRVERDGRQYRVIDVGSGNGTMVNNEVMVTNMPYTVQAGDRIIFSKKHQIVYRVC